MHTMFDTLLVTKKLEEQRMICNQAEAIVTVIRDTKSEFFTKDDGQNIEIKLNYVTKKGDESSNNKIDKFFNNRYEYFW